MHQPAFQVEAGNLGQLDAHILVLADDMPDGGRDLTGRDQPGGHLIQEWLKQVVVAPVHQRDFDTVAGDAAAGQEPGCRQAPEPAPDDHDPVRRRRPRSHPTRSSRSIRCSPIPG